MGKGDKKSKRGKIVNRSYGVRRPRKSKTTAIPEAAPAVVEAVVAVAKKTTEAAPKKAKKAADEAPKPKKTKKANPEE